MDDGKRTSGSGGPGGARKREDMGGSKDIEGLRRMLEGMRESGRTSFIMIGTDDPGKAVAIVRQALEPWDDPGAEEEERMVAVRYHRDVRYSKDVEVPAAVAARGGDAIREWLSDAGEPIGIDWRDDLECVLDEDFEVS